MTSLLGDAALARDLVDRIGSRLLEVRSGSGLSGSALRDAGDRAAQEIVAEQLSAWRPDDAVLSEEAPDPAARLRARRVWIVDPLDGTREFGEPGRSDWAVHVALWDGGELVAGAVALPAVGLTFGTDAPPRLLAPGVRPVVDLPGGGAAHLTASSASGVAASSVAASTVGGWGAGPVPVRMVVSRGRPPAFAAGLARTLGGVLLPMGSAGAKAASVWLGVADAYVHSGGQHEWDSAAPVAVARAAGLHASRLDGRPLEYNRPDPYLPDLLICRPELADPILAWTAYHVTEVTNR
jgi:3'(2'), 5'-bisphosphate nucleotidase